MSVALGPAGRGSGTPRRVTAFCAALILLALAGARPAAARQSSAISSVPAPPSPVLKARIDGIVNGSEFRAARWGVQAVDLGTGAEVYSLDQSRLFMPCSNMKLYSTALALALLGPKYRWKTSVYATAVPGKSGRVEGDLIVYGRGDPTFSTNFPETSPLRRIEQLADRIEAAGVRRVTGDLVADESYFTGARLGFGWEWNDLQWGYGAEVSALSFNDNVLDLSIAPGAKPGDPCNVTFDPPIDNFRVINRTRTLPKEAKQDLGVYRAEGSNVLDLWGGLPAGDKPFSGWVAVHDPAALFARLLRQALERRKIVIDGKTISIDARGRQDRPFNIDSAAELAWMESPQLADVVRVTNKISQNLYAELLVRTVGKVCGPKDALSADEAGLTAMREFLKAVGTDPENLSLIDGSGLSRRNLVTPESTVRLLTFALKQPYGQVFFESLPIAGAEGTLENRFKGSPAGPNVRAKTGTLADASSLSGFLVTRSGRQIAFSVMVNNVPGSKAAARRAIDSIVTAIYEE